MEFGYDFADELLGYGVDFHRQRNGNSNSNSNRNGIINSNGNPSQNCGRQYPAPPIPRPSPSLLERIRTHGIVDSSFKSYGGQQLQRNASFDIMNDILNNSRSGKMNIIDGSLKRSTSHRQFSNSREYKNISFYKDHEYSETGLFTSTNNSNSNCRNNISSNSGIVMYNIWLN